MTHYHWILPSKLFLKSRLHYEIDLLVNVRSCKGWNILFCSIKGLPHVRESKTVLDSGFHTVNSSLCQWNLDSGFHLFVGFQIPWAVFWIPKSRIPHSTSKILLNSGFQKQKFPRFLNQNSLTESEKVLFLLLHLLSSKTQGIAKAINLPWTCKSSFRGQDVFSHISEVFFSFLRTSTHEDTRAGMC